jgi:hypothetical protein
LIKIVLMRCMALSVTGDNFRLFMGNGRPANQSTGAQFYPTLRQISGHSGSTRQSSGYPLVVAFYFALLVQ